MTIEQPQVPEAPNDPALAVAERQLAVLAELVEMGLVVSRAYARAAAAASHAVEVILADEVWQPETGRARALAGAKDAADAYQKVSRSLRLTLMLQKATAENLRDLRAGIVPVQPDQAAAAAKPKPRRIVMNDGPDTAASPDADDEGDPVREERPGADRERLDLERPEVLPRGSYVTIVDRLAADIGATVDWDSSIVTLPDSPAAATPEPLRSEPTGPSEIRRPDITSPRNVPASSDREPALAP